jgi:hypothetical protein
MKKASDITRTELKKIDQSDKSSKDKVDSKNNHIFSEAELIPVMKLLYEIYIDSLKLLS